jgi:hypothetical protein
MNAPVGANPEENGPAQVEGQNQLMMLGVYYVANNVPGDSLQEIMQNAAVLIKNNNVTITIDMAKVIDSEMLGNYGNCPWTEFSFAPVGSRFNMGDGFIAEIVQTFGLTCNIVMHGL